MDIHIEGITYVDSYRRYNTKGTHTQGTHTKGTKCGNL